MPLTLRVLLPLPVSSFSYLPPVGQVIPSIGCRVLVPWRQETRIGIVSAQENIHATEVLNLREIIACLDNEPFINESALALINRASRYSYRPEGVVLQDLLATGLDVEVVHELRLLAGLDETSKAALHISEAWQDVHSCDPAEVDICRQQGLIEERAHFALETKRVLRVGRMADSALESKRNAAQLRAWHYLREHGPLASAAALARDSGISPHSVSTLVSKGYAVYEDIPVTQLAPKRHHSAAGCVLEPVLCPVPADLPLGSQLSLSGGLRRQRLAALLPLLQEDVRQGGYVLVLVPEHYYLRESADALATQLPVYTLSGSDKNKQRQRLWQHCKRLEPCVIVGTALALLLPLQFRTVVVLEAASDSYKMLRGARLFLPLAAQWLAELQRSRLLMSESIASPELVSDWPTHSLALPPLRLHVVNLRGSRNYPLSPELIRLLKQVESRERQAIILTPRRGFSSALCCQDCRHMLMCPHCDLPLRYNQAGRALHCHQCGHHQAVPQQCPQCQSYQLSAERTAGTQWLLQAIRRAFPDLLLKRYDSDQREDLQELYQGTPGVVVATSAIMRCAALPNISLLALSLFESTVYSGDFRADEASYRLLASLAELAPQRRPLVLLQTFVPEHPVLAHYQQGDPEAFLAALLERRRRFAYPPYSVMAKAQLSARSAAEAEHDATLLVATLQTAGAAEDEVLGPSPAPVLRLRQRYHYHVFLRCADMARLQVLLETVSNFRGRSQVRIDVQPRDLQGFIATDTL